MDGFDRLPDSLILQIFNSVSDIKTLLRCRAVSRRFNSLVPQAESLLLRVDRVIPAEPDDDVSSFIGFLKSALKSLHDLISPRHPQPTRTRLQNSPSQILSQFERIRTLEIELPSGDLKLEKGSGVKWIAEFGKSLKSCVILGFRGISDSAEYCGEDDGAELDFAGGLKVRVVWTISALMAASARHYLLKEVVREHGEMERVVLRDREREGTVVMDKEGLREFREGEAHVSEEWERSRTTVPSVRMRMRHEGRLGLKGGVTVEGATLVVVRPSVKDGGGGGGGGGEVVEEGALGLGAFEGLYGEAVQALLNTRSYLLEMNSF